MSKWEEYDFENRIVGILQELAGPRHHMGPAFLSPYQIAIEFTRRFTDDAQRLAEDGFGLGGEGAGVRNSLPQYIGQQLSARLRNGRITNIEGGFISSKRMANLSFKFGNRVIRSSTTQPGINLSLFRMRPR
jgi:hypothetical protein